jgi:hypothetical protein
MLLEEGYMCHITLYAIPAGIHHEHHSLLLRRMKIKQTKKAKELYKKRHGFENL